MKETLTLADASVRSSFTYRLGMSADVSAIAEGNSVLVLGGDGKPVFTITPPFATDAAGRSTSSVAMDLWSDEDGDLITVSVDPAWLADPERAWPVVVDPDVAVAPSADCWYQSGTSGTTQSCGGSSLNVGWNSNGTRRAVLKFDLPTDLIAGYLQSASLTMTAVSDNNSKIITVEADPATSPWSAPDVNWVNRTPTDSWSTPGGDFATSPSATFASTTTPNCPTPIGGTIPTGGTKCIMHFESIVNAWLSGTPNFGVILRQQNDTASPSNGNIVSFGSFETSVADQRPTLELTYQLPPPPVLVSVTDSPDPIIEGGVLDFEVSWSNSSAPVRAVICKTNAISAGVCTGGSWAATEVGSSETPVDAFYNTSMSDVGSHEYFAFACNDANVCSPGAQGSLSVAASPVSLGSLSDNAVIFSDGVMAEPGDHFVGAPLPEDPSLLYWPGTTAGATLGEDSSIDGSSPYGPYTVFQPDNLHQVDDTTKRPFRQVVFIRFPDRKQGGSVIHDSCTGFMISAHLVATAGHCVYFGGKWTPPTSVVPAKNGDSAPFGACKYKWLATNKAWKATEDERWDYGLIKLKCSIGETTGTWNMLPYPCDANSDTLGTNVHARIAGYPINDPDKEWGTMWTARGPVEQKNCLKVWYMTDTVSGMSGSPIYRYINGTAYAYAIHSMGKQGGDCSWSCQWNSGVRTSNKVLDWFASAPNIPHYP